MINTTTPAVLDRIKSAEETAQWRLQCFRDEIAKENSSPSQLILAMAEHQFKAEYQLQWIHGMKYSVSESGDGLKALYDEITWRLDSWTPCNSTSLLARLQGDIELEAMRSSRKLVKELIKLGE